jgi:hypothetical protein
MHGSDEKRRAYYRERYARLVAEGRCAKCGRTRAPGDSPTLRCAPCRAKQNERNARRYANRREQNPPAGSKGDPRQSFRCGTYRLDNKRAVRVHLDGELARSLGILRLGFVASGLWEPHSRSMFCRALLKLPLRIGAEGMVRPRPPIRLDDWVLGPPLVFFIDGECDGILSRYRARTGRNLSEAVRDHLYWSAEHLIASANGMVKPWGARPFHPNDFYKAVARPKPKPTQRPRHHTPIPRVFPGFSPTCR